MIIAVFSDNLNVESELLLDAFRFILPQHEWRGIIVSEEFVEEKVKGSYDIWHTTLLENELSTEKSTPDVFLVLLFDSQERPSWAATLYEYLRQIAPSSSIVWALWEISGVDTVNAFRDFQHPNEGSFLLNIEYPHDWPDYEGTTPEKFLDAMFFSDGVENRFSTFAQWLQRLIG